MTDAELSALESLARAATPGLWHNPGRCFVVARYAEDQPIVCDCLSNKFAQAPKDAKYIAAASPPKILELIAELRQAQAERDWIISKMEFMPCYRGRCPYPPEKEREVCMKTNKQQCWKDAAEKEAVCQKN